MAEIKDELIDVGVSPVFLANYNARTKIVVNQGGSRSGKTYSILQLIIFYWCRKHTGLTISIVRKTFPALRATAMRDFQEILESIGEWNEKAFKKSTFQYSYRGNTIEFLGMDNPTKKRGAKRDILFINEANELTFEDWVQLIMRTTMKCYIDYNPSDEYHWIYDRVVTRDDATFIQSTYMDNWDFLPKEIIQEIELLKTVDETYWKVYGLGERSTSQNTIYPKWEFCSEEDIFKVTKERNTVTYYGLDFGFNAPASLVKVVEDTSARTVYIQELIYKTGLTNEDLLQEIKNLNLPKDAEIFADSAEPKSIEDLQRAKLNVKPAQKEVYAGLMHCKSMRIFIESSSVHTSKEIKGYKWRLNAQGLNTDDPVKINDHAMDAWRYATYSYHVSLGKSIQGRAVFGFQRKRM